MKSVIVFLLLGGLQLAAQDMQSCPRHKEHVKEASQHQADVEKHGDEAMGFPHDKTTHHFRLYSDGGAIEVSVNDTRNFQNMQAIRSQLTHCDDVLQWRILHSNVRPRPNAARRTCDEGKTHRDFIRLRRVAIRWHSAY